MYYVTTDCLLSEGECILEDAEIVEYKTLSKARDHLLDSFAEVEEGYEIVIEPGYFKNYWKKTNDKPGPDNTDIDPFSWSEIRIFRVGNYLIGFWYKIIPKPQVLVTKLVKTKTPS